MRSLRFFLPAAAAILLFSAGLAAPEEPSGARESDPLNIKGVPYEVDRGLMAGPVRIHAYVSEFASYNSNIYLAKDAEKDWLFETLFGLRTDLFLDDNFISLFFDGDYINAAFDNHFDKLNYGLGTKGSLRSQSFFLDAKASWNEIKEPSSARIVDWSHIRRQELDTSLETGLRLGRLGIEAGGGFWLRRFGTGHTKTVTLVDGSPLDVSRDYLDHYEGLGNLRFALVWERLRVFAAATAGLVEFFDGVMHDYSYYSFVGGASLKITKKIDAEAVAGYALQNVQGIGRYHTLSDDAEFSGFVGSLTLKYMFSDKLRVSLAAVAALQFSGSSNYQIYDSISASVTHHLLTRLSWTLEGAVESIDPSDNHNYMIYRGSLTADLRLLKWAGLGLLLDLRMRNTHEGDFNYTALSGSLFLTLFF